MGGFGRYLYLDIVSRSLRPPRAAEIGALVRLQRPAGRAQRADAVEDEVAEDENGQGSPGLPVGQSAFLYRPDAILTSLEQMARPCALLAYGKAVGSMLPRE